MSANIHWKPTAKNTKMLDVPAPSAFQETMRNVGLELPRTITAADYDIIRGLKFGFGTNKEDRPNPYEQILDLLDKYESVDLWAEY